MTTDTDIQKCLFLLQFGVYIGFPDFGEWIEHHSAGDGRRGGHQKF